MNLPTAPVSTAAAISELLSALVLRAPEEIRPHTLLVQDLDVDSLGLIELIFAIEDRFSVKFPDLKTDAQMYGLPLPDAMERLESMEGGTTLLEFIKRATVENGGASLSAEEANGRFRAASATDLAHAVGGALPLGVDPEQPLGALCLADGFRFITVDVVARYVDFLRRNSEARGE